MRSARQTGATLLLTPVLIIAGISYFPSYDARPGRFVGSFDNIVTAGGRYLVSLVLFIVVAVLLGSLSYGLARGEIRDSASAMWVVIVGLGVSGVGFLVAGLTGLPVYNWAAMAADGSVSVTEMASRSKSLALPARPCC